MASRARDAADGRAGGRRVVGRRRERLTRRLAGTRFFVAARPFPEEADGLGFALLRFRGVATKSE